jgi:hypothetical protein
VGGESQKNSLSSSSPPLTHAHWAAKNGDVATPFRRVESGEELVSSWLQASPKVLFIYFFSIVVDVLKIDKVNSDSIEIRSQVAHCMRQSWSVVLK